MSRESRDLLAALLFTGAGFLLLRLLILPDATIAGWPLPLALLLGGLALAFWRGRAPATRDD